jgi:hypothetical protein
MIAIAEYVLDHAKGLAGHSDIARTRELSFGRWGVESDGKLLPQFCAISLRIQQDNPIGSCPEVRPGHLKEPAVGFAADPDRRMQVAPPKTPYRCDRDLSITRSWAEHQNASSIQAPGVMQDVDRDGIDRLQCDLVTQLAGLVDEEIKRTSHAALDDASGRQCVRVSPA